MLKGSAVIVVALLATLSLAPDEADGQSSPSQPQPFDGVWIIDASVASPFCPRRTRRLFLAVIGGRAVKVAGVTDPPPKAVGAVDSDGGVAMTITALGYAAQIHGTLKQNNGTGDWTSNSLLCAKGAWTAVKAN
jgi:hypothetical protein